MTLWQIACYAGGQSIDGQEGSEVKYTRVPLEGGEIQIDLRQRTVDLVLAVEDGSRVVRMMLLGSNADCMVRKIATALPVMQQDVLEQFTEWIKE